MFESLLPTGKANYPYPNDKFLGIYTSTEFITPADLSTALGVTYGTVNSLAADTQWMRFEIDDKEVIIPKKPLRYRLSWDQLNTDGLVAGTKEVTIGDWVYKVRLMKGAEANPSTWNTTDNTQQDPPSAGPSEWNRLMYRVYDWARGDWARFTTTDLGLTGNGQMTICLEAFTAAALSGYRVARGYTTIERFNYVLSSDGTASDRLHYGWRPVLVKDRPKPLPGQVFYFDPVTLTDTSNAGLAYTTNLTGTSSAATPTIFNKPTIRIGASTSILDIKFNVPWNMNTKELTVEWTSYVNPEMSTQYVNEMTLSKDLDLNNGLYLRWEQTSGGNGPLFLWYGASNIPISGITKANTADNKIASYALTVKNNKLALYINGTRVLNDVSLPTTTPWKAFNVLSLGKSHTNAIASPGNRSAIRISDYARYVDATYVVEPY